ncbi:MAG: peptide chain release factor N(5)-glutamine methyltransferase [Polyangiaceae bacterium]|nr:peptide chain release factor N(5)-glutamine methyltransferase [Polyangiaceae bacterium]
MERVDEQAASIGSLQECISQIALPTHPMIGGPMEENQPQEAWTIGRIIAWASADFQKRKIESPRLEVELLLCHLLGIDRVKLLLEHHRPLDQTELAAFKSLLTRRRQGEPSAYLLGEKEFYGHLFKVDDRVLIPRPDTEILVDVILEKTAHRKLDGRALDLCTGSGCIAISFAKERPTWRITGTDKDPEVLQLAQENALRLGAAWGLHWYEGDLFQALPEGSKFEVIASNPPYIPPKEIELLQTEVKDFEPRLALDGGEDGLEFYRKISRSASTYLVRGGVIALEVGAGQADDVSELLEKAGFQQVEKYRDYGGHERVVCARALS